MPYKSIRHTKLDERKIIIFNQAIENYITRELLEIDYWKSVCAKSLYLALFLTSSAFIGLSTEHLYLIEAQVVTASSISVQKTYKQNISNLIFIDNVLILPYERKHEETIMHLDKNINEYSVLAKIQMQLEIENYDMSDQIKYQEQYIKDMIAVILSSMTYQEILQKQSQVTLKINIKNKVNKFLSRGKIKDIHNVNIMYL